MHDNHDLRSDEEHAVRLETLFKSSQFFQLIQIMIRRAPSNFITSDMLDYQAPMNEQFKFLVPRAFNNLLRTPEILLARLFQTIFLALFISFVYMDVVGRAKDLPGLYQSLLGALFFLAINQWFASSTNALNVFAEERDIFMQEYSERYYSLFPYYATKLLVEFPMQILWPVLTALITYWIIGFRPGFDHFLVFTSILILLSCIGTATGLAFGFTFRSSQTAAAVSILITLPLIIYGGFFVNTTNSPAWISWLQWVSPIQYGFTTLLLNELQGRTLLGSSGNQELEVLGVFQRFGIGVNYVFLFLFYVFALLMAYLGLANSVKGAGLSQRPLNQIRKQIPDAAAS